MAIKRKNEGIGPTIGIWESQGPNGKHTIDWETRHWHPNGSPSRVLLNHTILGKFLNISVPLFSTLENGIKRTVCPG